jgi:hypothetical protein
MERPLLVPIPEVSDPFDHFAGDRGFENELSARLHGELRSGKSAPGVKAPGRPSRHAQGGRLPLIPPLSRDPLGPKLPESRSRGTLARAPQWGGAGTRQHVVIFIGVSVRHG